MAEDLALDLQELRHLQSIAERPRIVNLISSEIRNLEKVYVNYFRSIRLPYIFFAAFNTFFFEKNKKMKLL